MAPWQSFGARINLCKIVAKMARQSPQYSQLTKSAGHRTVFPPGGNWITVLTVGMVQTNLRCLEFSVSRTVKLEVTSVIHELFLRQPSKEKRSLETPPEWAAVPIWPTCLVGLCATEERNLSQQIPPWMLLNPKSCVCHGSWGLGFSNTEAD